MVDTNNIAGHRAFLESLLRAKPRDQALTEYVGLADLSIGHREKEAIARHHDLDNAYVVDIGCGIGRLTAFMPEEPIRKYLGTDILPEVLDEARRKANGDPRFGFQPVTTMTIPEVDGAADIVCAFSVMTHLLDEQVFSYFQEAARVLVSGGVAVFSFFDFSLPSHREIFVDFARKRQLGRHDVLKWFEKSTLRFFAEANQLEVIEFQDAKTLVPAKFGGRTLADGRKTGSTFAIGQSLIYMRKP